MSHNVKSKIGVSDTGRFGRSVPPIYPHHSAELTVFLLGAHPSLTIAVEFAPALRSHR